MDYPLKQENNTKEFDIPFPPIIIQVFSSDFN